VLLYDCLERGDAKGVRRAISLAELLGTIGTIGPQDGHTDEGMISRSTSSRLASISGARMLNSWAFLLTNEALEMGLINRIKSLYGLLNLRVW
jgi:hypothetical protein